MRGGNILKFGIAAWQQHAGEYAFWNKIVNCTPHRNIRTQALKFNYNLGKR